MIDRSFVPYRSTNSSSQRHRILHTEEGDIQRLFVLSPLSIHRYAVMIDDDKSLEVGGCAYQPGVRAHAYSSLIVLHSNDKATIRVP
jgi:hypothetical protein